MDNDDKDPPTHNGEVLYDASVYHQDTAYPTNLNLLNTAREITEQIIDFLHDNKSKTKKSRTYRRIARKLYLKVVQNKNPSGKEIKGALNNIANKLTKQCKYEQVLEFYSRALMLSQLYGLEQNVVAKTKHIMAFLYKRIVKNEEVVKINKELLEFGVKNKVGADRLMSNIYPLRLVIVGKFDTF